jgi:N-acetyl-alpha-D-muramate 1-phosphate uridylyltransferase
MLLVAILCGGKATRIAHLARGISKTLIPLAGEPFLAYQLRWLRNEGASDVVLLTGQNFDAIRACAGDGRSFGLSIRYSEDGPLPLGTAGAVRNALPLLGDRFLTVYGDALPQVRLEAVGAALAPPFEGVMTVFRNQDQGHPSNAAIDGERVAAYDKGVAPGTMTHMDYGVNAFRAESFVEVPQDRCADLAEVHRAMVARGTLRAFPVYERWYEIGSPDGLAETEQFIVARSTRREPAQ